MVGGRGAALDNEGDHMTKKPQPKPSTAKRRAELVELMVEELRQVTGGGGADPYALLCW